MNRHGRRRKRSVTLWSENAAAGTTHPAHNSDYCSLSVPLTNDSGNGQIADLDSGAGLFAAVAGLVGKKKGERRE